MTCNQLAPAHSGWLLRLATLTLVLAGCSVEERVTTNTLLANANCKGASAGLQRVSLADVAAYRGRGTQLIIDTASAPQTEQTSGPQATSLPLFVAISRGPQTARGFELQLADQALVVEGPDRTDGPDTIEGAQLKIPVSWTKTEISQIQPSQTELNPSEISQTPPNQTPINQTPIKKMHPCLVVSVPDRDWASIEAIDQNGEVIGRLLK